MAGGNVGDLHIADDDKIRSCDYFAGCIFPAGSAFGGRFFTWWMPDADRLSEKFFMGCYANKLRLIPR